MAQTHSSLVYTQLSLDIHSGWKLGYTAKGKSNNLLLTALTTVNVPYVWILTIFNLARDGQVFYDKAVWSLDNVEKSQYSWMDEG